MDRILMSILIFSMLSPSQLSLPFQEDAGSSIPAGVAANDPTLERIRHQIEKLGVGQKVTLITLNGTEYYGTIAQVGASGVQLLEVDMKQLLAIPYDQLKTVRKGYGRINSVTGKRVNPRVGRIVFFAFLGFLFGMTAIVASSD